MISYGRHSLNRRDRKAVSEVLSGEWLTLGPKVPVFESAISDIIGAESFVLSSGTAALHCAYAALNLKPGDEIITPPLTFVATQAAAMHFGARIVFADVTPETGQMDPAVIESLITDKTRALVGVDYAGHPGYLDEYKSIAKANNLFFVEDAAHSMGSLYKGLPVGQLADLTTFSFFPTKNITTGEGGAVSSNNSALLDKARKFGRQGMVKDPIKFITPPEGRWHQEVHEIGLNYRLPDILATLGASQISRLGEFKKKRKDLFDYYQEQLSGFRELTMPYSESFVDPMWHLFPLRVKRGLRNELFEYLWKNDILVQVNYVPSYFHPVFRKLGYEPGLCPVAEQYYREEISLPLHPNLTKRDLDKVSRVIYSFLRNN